LCSYSYIFQHYMQPEGSLPCSQEPSSGHYPEPDRLQSIPPHPISLLILSNYILLALPSGLFPSGFPTKILYSSCPAHLSLLDLIILIIFAEEYRFLSSSLCSFIILIIRTINCRISEWIHFSLVFRRWASF
jgi:hypothetical protein